MERAMSKWIVSALLLLSSIAVYSAEAPDIQWSKTFGSERHECCNWAQVTSDSGVIMVGYTIYGGDRWQDIYVVKTDKDGNLDWEEEYGSEQDEFGRSVCQTPDGGFAVTGYTRMHPPGGYDFYLMKLNSAGVRLWDEEYDITDVYETGNSAHGICLTPDGGFAISGHACCYEGHSVLQLAKTDSLGVADWNTAYDTVEVSESSVIATRDGGYATIGTVSGTMKIVKFDSAGTIELIKNYGFGGFKANLIELDNGYMAFGTRNFSTPHYQDFWMLKLTPDLDTLWTVRSYTVDEDACWAGAQTFDGGFIMAGDWYPPGEENNIYVIRTDSLGNILWTKSIGGEYGEYAAYVSQTPDSGYVIAGRTRSYGAGDYDFYLVKLYPDDSGPTAVAEDDNELPLGFRLEQNYPNPFNPYTVIEFDLPQQSMVSVTIFNLLGQQIATLADKQYPPGHHRLIWDGHTSGAVPAPTGIYLYRLETEDYVDTRKMILLK